MTILVPVSSADPDPSAIRQAADMLQAGGLVAFPTETVYGLGANALDPIAVQRIFEAKGRPATNPVIVHVAAWEQVFTVAAEWPEVAAKLAARFWPGPLSLVVPKRPEVPDAVTAGGPTVAVRWPAHPVAVALIRAAGVPVAAPSANRSTELSPTRAEHVWKSLNGRIDCILDGAPCPGGIESTVVDVTGPVVRLLRPGLVSLSQLEAVVGHVEVGASAGSVARSPGQMAKHYSPRTRLILAEPGFGAFDDHGLRVVVMGFDRMPRDPVGYAQDLYAVLHELDEGGYDRIVVAMPPDTAEWAGVRDRLMRAAS